jgi:hypothetical protein
MIPRGKGHIVGCINVGMIKCGTKSMHTTGLIEISDLVKSTQVENDLIKDGHGSSDQARVSTLRTNCQPILRVNTRVSESM